MRMLERNEKIIYHSKRNLTDDGIEYFDVPVALRCNPMPVSTDWSRTTGGTIETGMKRFIISRDTLRNALVFNAYGYDHPIEGESHYGMTEVNPYGWVDEYLTRWIHDLTNGDRFYVDAQTPDTLDDEKMAVGADYVVAGVEDTPNYIGVILRRLAV